MSTTEANHEMLANARWLRALALHLVRDPHEADDLAQETITVALAQPPSHSGNVRGWLGTVLRNCLLQRRRSASRRERREAAVVPAEPPAEPADILDRAHRQHELVECVLQLAEPFRTAILLRYFDELPPREIARRMEVPVATVQSQLHRGLRKLRAVLDRRHGERAAWAAPLLALAQPPRSWTPFDMGVLLMHTKAKLAAAFVGVLAVAAITFAAVYEPETSITPRAGDGSQVGSTAPPAPTTGVPQDAAAGAREVLAASGEPATKRSVSGAERTVRGRVFDTDARPRADVRLQFRGGGEAIDTTSDIEGRFTFEPQQASGEISARDAGLVTICAGQVALGGSIDPVVVIAERAAVGGRVVDADGRGLGGAKVLIEFPGDFLVRFETVLDASVSRVWKATTDADGRFAIPDAPRCKDARIRVARSGYRPHQRAMVERDANGLRIVLERIVVEADALAGQVLDPGGRPVAGAFVGMGTQASTRTDERGNFRLPLRSDAAQLLAVKSGFQPALLRPLAGAKGRARWPEFAVLYLGGPPKRLAGLVVDTKGRPVAGARVWLDAPTPFGLIDQRPARVENLLRGGGGDWFHRFVTTDAEGRFTLGGLMAQDYALQAMETATLVRGKFGPFTAGREDLRLELDTGACHAPVRGVVVSRLGKPVPGVTITPVTEVARASYPVRDVRFSGSVEVEVGPEGPRTTVSRPASGKSTRTDRQGRFRIAKVPEKDVVLYLRGDAIAPRAYRIQKRDDVAKLVLEVTLRMHFRVELADSEQADGIRILDAGGEPMDILEIRANSENANDFVRLSKGRTRTLSISELATDIVFYKERREVARRPLNLAPGRVNVIRL